MTIDIFLPGYTLMLSKAEKDGSCMYLAAKMEPESSLEIARKTRVLTHRYDELLESSRSDSEGGPRSLMNFVNDGVEENIP